MHFTADPKELIRIFGVLVDINIDEDEPIFFAATSNRFIAEQGTTKVGTVAMVFDSGQFIISHRQLREILKALKHRYGKFTRQDNISVKITEHRLEFGAFIVALGSKKMESVEISDSIHGLQSPEQNPEPASSNRDWLVIIAPLAYVAAGLFVFAQVYFGKGQYLFYAMVLGVTIFWLRVITSKKL